MNNETLVEIIQLMNAVYDQEVTAQNGADEIKRIFESYIADQLISPLQKIIDEAPKKQVTTMPLYDKNPNAYPFSVPDKRVFDYWKEVIKKGKVSGGGATNSSTIVPF